ncbi:hypothetical protein I4U23_031422 [Adineta vaga]|nr:hypothetical protein I4U23_031422 [Adineta vaga]
MIHLCTTQFWDKNITSSPYPYLTECFRNTVLQWMPIGIFWLITPLPLYILLKRQIQLQPLPISTLFIIKMILAILCLLVQIMRIIHYVMLPTTKQYHALWLTPVLYMITMIFILWLMNYDRRKGTFSSGLFFIFWLLVCLAIVPDVIDCFAQFQQQNKSIALWMGCVCTWLHLFVALGSFVANCFAEKYVSSELELDPRPIVPEQYASFLSQIFYSWATPLILQGYKKPLTEDDCWQLPISERTVSMVRRVRTFLPESNNRTTTIVDKSNTSCNDDEIANRNHSEDESRDLLNNMPLVVVNKTPIRSHKKIVFWHALFHAFKDKLIAGGLMRLIYDILQLTIPMIIKLFLNFFTDPKNPTWLGIFYAILLSTIVFCQILFLRAYFHCQRLLGFRFRAAITGLVYRKSLKLSNSSKQATTTGEIINLMTIDASRFNDIGSEIHHIWSSPVMIILSIYLLYRQMQLAIIPGVTLLLLMISINLFLQKIQKKFTVQQMILKDQRIQMTNEILNGIKVLKLYAWETTFIRSVTHIREKELRYIRYKSILSAISNVLSTFTPILVCIVTFATYVLSSNTNVLTAEKAFVSLALFNLLQTPLAKFPTTINSIVEASVSDQRIQKFLNYEEIDVDAVNKLSSGPDTSKFSDGNSVKIEDGSFHWSNHIDDQLVLKNINLKIRHGSLVALVGKVSSGKSSILATLLGEMTKVNGRVTISGNLAYVPQTAWIMNTTLKKNILFGRDFDQKRYDRIIEACSLKQDLDILPARDETEIGEKGINLSGGQRQRVSLARSLYTDADIFLLDDPLSAVDAHVGAHIFEHVIGPRGLLSDKTRIFVTHTLSHLHKCDDIVVISHGEIVDHGSYNELMQKSKILKELVHSVVTSEKEQHQQQASKVEMRKRAPATPIELIQNPCHKIQDDIPNDQSQLTTIEIIPSDIEEVEKQLIQKEVLQTGSVKLNIYTMYIKACKFSMVALIILFFCLTVCAALGTNIWLSKWTDNSKVEAVKNVTSSSSNHQIYRLYVYSALGIAQGFLGFFMQLTLKFAAYGAARKLHWMLLIGVLHAPMSFFDTTPIGRIINRFAKDVDSIDSVLPNSFSFSLKTLVPVVVTLAILIYGSWFVIIVLLPLAILFAFIQRVFVSTSRQLRRLDSTTRSLIYANFGETIQGVSSIRAYNVQQRFIDISDHFIDINQSCAFANSVANTYDLSFSNTFEVFFSFHHCYKFQTCS